MQYPHNRPILAIMALAGLALSFAACTSADSEIDSAHVNGTPDDSCGDACSDASIGTQCGWHGLGLCTARLSAQKDGSGGGAACAYDCGNPDLSLAGECAPIIACK